MPALKTCSVPGCPALVPQGQSRCAGCAREAESRRGSSARRGYGKQHRMRFREGVLAREPICKVCMRRPSTVADHWPLSKRDLIQRKLDDNDPKNGRGLCKPCHDRETARSQPGGWNDRTSERSGGGG